MLPVGTAQDLLNVDVTPGGKSVKKRKGYAIAQTLSNSTSAVHGIYTFYDSSGNDVVLVFNDRNMSASVNGGSPTVIYSTGTLNATYQCVDSQGYAYCASTARDRVIRTNGATFSSQVIIATGTQVALTPTRLVTAGIASTPNRIDFSKENDFTVWTVGSQPADPIQWTITAPGSRITHIVYAHQRIYWFKENSFGYILEGPTHTDWVTRIVSPEVGTLDNTSVVREDVLYFRGQDGHVYSFDGGTLTKLSRPIGTTTDSAQSRASNSLTLGSNGSTDWVAGTFSGNTVYVDTTTDTRLLATTFPESFSGNLRDGTLSTKLVWTKVFYGPVPGTASVSGGKLNLADLSTTPAQANDVGISTLLPRFQEGVTTQIKIESISVNTSQNSTFNLTFSTHQLTYAKEVPGSIYFTWVSTSAGLAYLLAVHDGVNSDATLYTSTSVVMPFTFQVWHSTLAVSYSVNGNLVKYANITDAGGYRQLPTYVGLFYDNQQTTGSSSFDNFSVYPQTFTFVSAAQTVSSSITSWDSFNAVDNAPNGTINYAIRPYSTGTYTSISKGATPTIATSTYWQVVATVTASSFPSDEGSCYIDSITQNWFEGSATDKTYATYFDNKILWEVAAGDGATTNNKTLVWDMLNQSWTLYDLPSNGFYVRNQSLYFGSATSGYIYKFGDVDADNGSAINSYWKSKDFFLSDPAVDNELVTLSTVADGSTVAGSSITLTYTLNGSSSTAIPVSIYTANTFSRSNKNLPAGRVGALLNVMFGNNAAGMPWEVFGVGYTFRPKPWNTQ